MTITQTFSTQIVSMPGWEYASCIWVPEEVATVFVEAGIKRLVCMVNSGEHFHCGLNKKLAKGHFIMFSKARQKESEVSMNEKIEITLMADESEYGMPMPVEWEEVLAIDEEAYEIFRSLTPGRQRSILYMVGAAKREETRITRALRIAENLKMGVRDSSQFMKKNG